MPVPLQSWGLRLAVTTWSLFVRDQVGAYRAPTRIVFAPPEPRRPLCSYLGFVEVSGPLCVLAASLVVAAHPLGLRRRHRGVCPCDCSHGWSLLCRSRAQRGWRFLRAEDGFEYGPDRPAHTTDPVASTPAVAAPTMVHGLPPGAFRWGITPRSVLAHCPRHLFSCVLFFFLRRVFRCSGRGGCQWPW